VHGAVERHTGVAQHETQLVQAHRFGTLHVGDRLRDDIAGAAALGISTAQAVWFHADDPLAGVEPDFLAFTPADVLTAVARLSA